MSDPTKWKPIDANRAVRSVKAGAKVWKLQSPFFSGGATYAHALQTPRGTCYVVSNWVMSSVVAAQAEIAQLAIEAMKSGGRGESSDFQPC
ncbi:hypothetical protein [Pseudomonas serbica]|uniref:hypothetical protein n=1 Tax=Pseudomonas serbica TaxID=2965074 RepID=UPI00237A1782|nr:hypothetical protein [Pseudomonas serbica]